MINYINNCDNDTKTKTINHHHHDDDNYNVKGTNKGFALTTINLMLNYPIDCVDSVVVEKTNKPTTTTAIPNDDRLKDNNTSKTTTTTTTKVKLSRRRKESSLPNTTNEQQQEEEDNEYIICDKVIITVPLGVLKSNMISFNGEFVIPDEKQYAIDTINMYSGMKCHILLRYGIDIIDVNVANVNVVADNDDDNSNSGIDIVQYTELFFCPNEICSQVWIRRNNKSVFITGFIVAENSDDLRNRINNNNNDNNNNNSNNNNNNNDDDNNNDGVAKVICLDQLKRMFVNQKNGQTIFINKNNPSCSAFALHDWSNDEYTNGIYSSPSVGAGWQIIQNQNQQQQVEEQQEEEKFQSEATMTNKKYDNNNKTTTDDTCNDTTPIDTTTVQTCRHYLAKNIKNCIFFAGEHTNVNTCATVQAALESGISAANEIQSLLSKQQQEEQEQEQDR